MTAEYIKQSLLNSIQFLTDYMTDEAVIISCGGIAASHLQRTNSKKQSIKGSSKTKKGESRL